MEMQLFTSMTFIYFFFPIFSIFHNKENFLLYFVELIGSILFDYSWCTIPSVCVFAKYLFKLITKKKKVQSLFTPSSNNFLLLFDYNYILSYIFAMLTATLPSINIIKYMFVCTNWFVYYVSALVVVIVVAFVNYKSLLPSNFSLSRSFRTQDSNFCFSSFSFLLHNIQQFFFHCILLPFNSFI